MNEICPNLCQNPSPTEHGILRWPLLVYVFIYNYEVWHYNKMQSCGETGKMGRGSPHAPSDVTTAVRDGQRSEGRISIYKFENHWRNIRHNII